MAPMECTKCEWSDRRLAGTVIFCISFVGSMANWLVVTSSRRLPSMRNSFGVLMTSQSSGEAVLCSVFAFYYSPMVFFNIDAMEHVSKRFGIVLLICYDICILSHLFIALNRMCAICFPWKYDKYFSKSNTRRLIVISWILSFTRCFLSYIYRDCDFVYDDSIWAFVFTQTEDCKFISKYLDFIRDLTIVIIIGIVDTITVIKVRISSAKAVLQGIVFAVELYTYFILAWQMQNKWAVWALTTMAWNLVHCTDALIVIGYNAEFRKLVSSPTLIFKTKIHTQVSHSSIPGERFTEK
ncbi:hypothetical protein RB195_016194 [Necator americanus]|uniref:G-protein coupled receptors family 1 profile domain-containing protein n=1 Tax=Necator americanus TaxID=51031 RepID=A0ABR1E8D0_NECAM